MSLPKCLAVSRPTCLFAVYLTVTFVPPVLTRDVLEIAHLLQCGEDSVATSRTDLAVFVQHVRQRVVAGRDSATGGG